MQSRIFIEWGLYGVGFPEGEAFTVGSPQSGVSTEFGYHIVGSSQSGGSTEWGLHGVGSSQSGVFIERGLHRMGSS